MYCLPNIQISISLLEWHVQHVIKSKPDWVSCICSQINESVHGSSARHPTVRMLWFCRAICVLRPQAEMEISYSSSVIEGPSYKPRKKIVLWGLLLWMQSSAHLNVLCILSTFRSSLQSRTLRQHNRDKNSTRTAGTCARKWQGGAVVRSCTPMTAASHKQMYTWSKRIQISPSGNPCV